MRKLRYWIKKHLAWMRIPVQSGPLKGMWIGVNCGMRFIRGDYDRSAVATLTAALKPGMVMYDIGAHVGYLSMVAARVVGDSGRIVAFEPLDLNLSYLRGHVRSNRIANIQIVDACVGEKPGSIAFDLGKGTGRGRMVESSAGVMRVVSIDDQVLNQGLPPPRFIKMDVEGAELMALQGAEKTLRAHRPDLFVSVHSALLRQQCSDFLTRLGYAIQPTKKRNELMASWAGNGLDAAPPLIA
ncbi:MAG: FkbM family methyltransferase [Panacagrimonas sp.]